MCDVTHWSIHMCDVTHWSIYVRDVTALDVWHDSFMCVTWLLHMLIHLQSPTSTPVTCVTWLIDPFICVTWLLHVCDITLSHVWHDSFIVWFTFRARHCPLPSITRVTWPVTHWSIYVRDVTALDVWHDSSHKLCPRLHVWRDPSINSHVWYDYCICVTWLLHMLMHFWPLILQFVCVRMNKCAYTYIKNHISTRTFVYMPVKDVMHLLFLSRWLCVCEYVVWVCECVWKNSTNSMRFGLGEIESD